MRFSLSLLALLLGLTLSVSGCQTSGQPVSPVSPTAGTASPDTSSPLAGAGQLVLVVAEHFDADQARLRRFERSGTGRWKPVGDDVAVTIGRNGLAWGRGLHGTALGAGPVKVEGDGRTPAGVFSVVTGFAYQPADLWKPAGIPMRQVTAKTVCVERISSPSYNRIVEDDGSLAADGIEPDKMLRPDGLYRFGLMLGLNTPETKPGAGSCVFFHLWRRPGAPTAGCTAMNEPALQVVLTWLDAAKHPVVVQLPRAELERLAPAWGAPELLASASRTD